jgi:hypothetical protein
VLVGLVPIDVVTVTSTIVVIVDPDTASVGDVAVSEVSLVTMKPVAGVEPNVTAVDPLKPVPVTVTEVPPEVGPDSGLIPVMVGVVAAAATLPGWLPTTGRTKKTMVAVESPATRPVAPRARRRAVGGV